MTEIQIYKSLNKSIIEQLGQALNCETSSSYTEQVLSFNNPLGKGTIRSIDFEQGMSLIDYDVCFNEDVKISFNLSNHNILEFLYISDGELSYSSNQTEIDHQPIKLNCYQNIILSNLPNASNTYLFPSGKSIKINTIQINCKNYNNTFISSWQASLKSILSGQKQEIPYLHLGNYNLNLAYYIEGLNTIKDEGICKFLYIEGQLKKILSMQLLEHKNYENKLYLPHSLSKKDLLKTKAVIKYITDNLHGVYTVADLAAMHSFSPKKMQNGFQLLKGKTVNEFIREKKLDYAMHLIKSSEYSISEIVYQIGYRSRSYFSKIFFETFKILPIDYRDLIRSNQQIISK